MVPIHIHPNNGEISNNEQSPQKANNKAMEIINRLSLVRFFGIITFMNKPNKPPIIKASKLSPIGLTMLIKLTFPLLEAMAMEIAML